MDEDTTQTKAPLRRPVMQYQQPEEKKERITKITAAFMIITAASIDIFEAVLDVLIIGEVLSPIISICADIGFWIWFKIHGVSFTKNPKNFTAMGVQALVGILPGVDILPELTVGVVVIVLATRSEDKGGLLSKATGALGGVLSSQKADFEKRLNNARGLSTSGSSKIPRMAPRSRFAGAATGQYGSSVYGGYGNAGEEEVEEPEETRKNISEEEGEIYGSNNVLDLSGMSVESAPTHQVPLMASTSTIKESPELEAGHSHRRSVENVDIEETQVVERNDAQSRTERISTAIEKLNEQSERLKETDLRPKVGILADRDKIENQQIDIIQAQDEKALHINFKLTETHYNALKGKYADNEQTSITYGNGEQHFNLANCWEKEIDGVTVKVSTGKNKGGKDVRTALGLVELTILNDGENRLTAEQISEKINQILTQELEISDGMSLPDTDAESKYKQNRYKWEHKSAEAPADVENLLVREEVAPGYFTFTEKEKHKEYEKINPYAVYHHVHDADNIPAIIKAGGLISTHERYKRGMAVNGLSSGKDLETGGGDSVFTRIVTEDGLKDSEFADHDASKLALNITLIFESDLLDRTDWYSYDRDRFGSTDSETFKSRQSPEEILKTQRVKWGSSNEQMFRTGIGVEKIKAIACSTENDVGHVCDALREAGITEINGKPVEQMVVMAPKVKDYIAISQGKQPKYEKPITQIIEEQAQISRKVKERETSTEVEKIEKFAPSMVEATGQLQNLKNVLQTGNTDSATADTTATIGNINKVIEEFPTIWVDKVPREQRSEMAQHFLQLADHAHGFQNEELFNLPYEGKYKKVYVDYFVDAEQKLRNFAQTLEKSLLEKKKGFDTTSNE
jgi:hypothetical protein